MAYERQSDLEIKGEGFDAFVEGTLKMFERQFAIRNAADELNFSRLVLENNLSLQDQLKYRQEQLKRVKDDPNERRRIRSEISSLKDRVEQKEFADAFLKQIIDVESGVSSVDSLLTWLRTRRDATTDLNVQTEINKQIVGQERNKFTLQQQALENQTNFALNDKTESVLNAQIEKISSAKTQALLSGNTDLNTTFDLQLQALNKAKQEAATETDIKNFAVATIAGSSTAVGLLDSFNEKTLNSSAQGTVAIGGTTYASAREFWTFKRDSYLADNSQNGFFTRVKDEQKSNLSKKNSSNLLGNGDIAAASRFFDDLAGRAELQAYVPILQNSKQEIIQTGADYRSQTVLNQYAKDLDVTAASNALRDLRKLGANVDVAETNVITAAAETKQLQVSGILSTAKSLIDADPNLTAEQAVQQAIKAGSGIVLSPQEAVEKTEAEIATEAAKTAEAGTGAADTRTTIQQEKPAGAALEPAPIPEPTPPLAITSQFDLGQKDPQVKELQRFLNQQGFALATQGPGSVGQETEFFGPLTQAALKKFQAAQGIVSKGDPISTGFGRLGPQTLAAIQKITGSAK